MNKRILVNYQGGYCGSFFCGLIARALDVDHILEHDNKINIYYYSNKDIKTMYVKTFGKLFDIRKGVISKEELNEITEKKLDACYVYAKNLYKIVDDEDEQAFIENIKSYFSDLMTLQKSEYLIASIHYAYRYKDVDIHDIFPGSTILHIVTENKRHARYFHLLYHYKTKDDETDKVLQKNTLTLEQIKKDFIDVISPSPFDDSSIHVDMGKLIFNRDYDHFSEIERKLSESIGKPVVLDRTKFYEYADRNIDIIKKILGDDFMQQTEKVQIEKSIKFIEGEVRVKRQR
jgi:hypothetical protein